MSFTFRHTHPGKVETKSPPPPPGGKPIGLIDNFDYLLLTCRRINALICHNYITDIWGPSINGVMQEEEGGTFHDQA